ncbi:hypothetical protein AeMF1_003695 [Aphanomyces euteiches]|nr:hypothetical protein AeMF1_003695 [Aphanomyces euteiches]KAH9189305.1 hypothetical protein AeNC1_008717 [Aphanomyces euteiches]
MTILMVVDGCWSHGNVVGLIRKRMAEDKLFFWRFCSTVNSDGEFEADVSFDPAMHIHAVNLDDSITPLGFAEQMSAMPLDRAHPLWHCYVISPRGKDANTTHLLWRIHHSIGDASVNAFFVRLSDSKIPPPMVRVPRYQAPSWLKRLKLIIWSLWLYLCKWWQFMTRPEPSTCLKPSNGGKRRKRLFYTTHYSVKETKQLARRLGMEATVNDIFVSCITGALRTMLLLDQPDMNLRSSFILRAGIPVDMRPWSEPINAPDNQFSCLLVDLPVGEASPLDRTKRVIASMKQAKGSLERQMTYAISLAIAQLPRWLLPRAIRFITSHSSVAISNVRGPPHVLHFSGHALLSLNGYVPPPPNVRLGVAIYSMGDALGISVQVDSGIFSQPERFLKCIQDEYFALQQLASPPAN